MTDSLSSPSNFISCRLKLVNLILFPRFCITARDRKLQWIYSKILCWELSLGFWFILITDDTVIAFEILINGCSQMKPWFMITARIEREDSKRKAGLYPHRKCSRRGLSKCLSFLFFPPILWSVRVDERACESERVRHFSSLSKSSGILAPSDTSSGHSKERERGGSFKPRVSE